MKLACARVTGLRLAASTAWSTSVKGSYGDDSASQASARAVHSSASAGGGGVRLARWRRSASARPSRRSTWKPSDCTPGRIAGSIASKAAVPDMPARIAASAWAVSCNWRQSGGEREGSERSDKRWMVTTASVDDLG